MIDLSWWFEMMLAVLGWAVVVFGFEYLLLSWLKTTTKKKAAGGA